MELSIGSNFNVVNKHRIVSRLFNCNEIVITDRSNNIIEISFYTEPGYRVELIHSQDKLGMDGECTHEYTDSNSTIPLYVEQDGEMEDWY